MTTPTREQVAQWGETQYSPNFMKMNIKYMTALYELARADIEATIAEQAKQLEQANIRFNQVRATRNKLLERLEEMAEAIRVKDEAILLVINDDESLWAIGENGSKKLTTALAILPSPEILVARDQRVIAEYLASMSHKESGE